MSDPVREGIQRLLDLYDDGWTVAHYIVGMGLERITDGGLETCTWHYAPPDQPGYVTGGLIDATRDALIRATKTTRSACGAG